MSCGAELQMVPTRLQDGQGHWLTKSQFRRVNGGHNSKWNRALAKWRAQWRNRDIFELQVLVSERDAALSDARMEARQERHKLDEARAEALCSAQQANLAVEDLELALAEANRKIIQLTSDRDRAIEGRCAARKNARKAAAAHLRSQQSADVAERRTVELEQRLGFAERGCKRRAAMLEVTRAGAAYWQQRALSAEGQLRGAQRRITLAEVAIRGLRAQCAEQEDANRVAKAEVESCRSRLAALEELVRDGKPYLRVGSSSVQHTPPRAEGESHMEPTLPRSSTPTGSSDVDLLCRGGGCALFEAKPASDTSAVDTADDGPTTIHSRECSSCGGEGHDCDHAVTTVEFAPSPDLTQGAALCTFSFRLNEEQIVCERSCAAASHSHIVHKCAQGHQWVLRRQELTVREREARIQLRASAVEGVIDVCRLALVRLAGAAAVPVHQEEKMDRVLCHTAAAQERARILVRDSQLRAARAELRLLPHSEIGERSRVEMEQSEAHWELTNRVFVDAEVAPHGQLQKDCAASAGVSGSHPDAGWFLTLNVISISVAQFAPSAWAPLCHDAALSVYCVHQHWLTAAREVHRRIVANLDAAAEAPDEERFDPAEEEWTRFIMKVGSNIPINEMESRRILLMHSRAALNHLQGLRVDLQQFGQTMRRMGARVRLTIAAMKDILGSEELEQLTP
eukprot:TRINITY_DN3777_c0_g1_i1.p1 TRINITY_DN3777_c0_g1~~TRINITY_DN3777_c0_g1_i1.p1  ORF type:complete len:704 (+),score=152.87 TRINITY_DN3777_c0_g1_i1:66-2114(+)